MLDDRTATKPRNMSLKKYRKMKLDALNDFGIEISDKEMYHFFTLKTEIAIDNYYIYMIQKYL